MTFERKVTATFWALVGRAGGRLAETSSWTPGLAPEVVWTAPMSICDRRYVADVFTFSRRFDVDINNVKAIFDSDTHCIEHPMVWKDRLPKKWGDQVMHIEYDPVTKRDFWFLGDVKANVGWPNAYYGSKGDDIAARRMPATQADVDPSCYDPKARLALMDSWGIQAAVLYPNAAGFSLEPFMRLPDPELSFAHASAYNDFIMEEWVGAAPGRFVPMAVVPYWNIEATVKEIERIAGKGYGGFVMTGAPQLHDQPFLRDPHWDPMWAAAQAAELPIAFHVANGDPKMYMQEDLVNAEPEDITSTRVGFNICIDNAMQCADLLLSGVLGRFPTLKFVISESGVGWVPFMLESCDDRFRRQSMRLPEFNGLLPSEIFQRQIHVNCYFERIQPYHLEWTGVDNLMFQTDVPHPTGFYMFEGAELMKDSIEPCFQDLDDDTANRILWDNGAELYAPSLALGGGHIGR